MYIISQLKPQKKFCHLIWHPVVYCFALKYVKALWSVTTVNLQPPVSSLSHLVSASRMPKASSSYLKYPCCMAVKFLDMNNASLEVFQLAPCARMAPTPVGQASVMTQTL